MLNDLIKSFIVNCLSNIIEHLTPEETKVAVDAILKYRNII